MHSNRRQRTDDIRTAYQSGSGKGGYTGANVEGKGEDQNDPTFNQEYQTARADHKATRRERPTKGANIPVARTDVNPDAAGRRAAETEQCGDKAPGGNSKQ